MVDMFEAVWPKMDSSEPPCHYNEYIVNFLHRSGEYHDCGDRREVLTNMDSR